MSVGVCAQPTLMGAEPLDRYHVQLKTIELQRKKTYWWGSDNSTNKVESIVKVLCRQSSVATVLRYSSVATVHTVLYYCIELEGGSSKPNEPPPGSAPA